ncbi:AMP-binding protein [Thiorhodococcus mannitoliphagus]|uniref:AMP-binding protein n=1 Tax=Thiorhodococcus mannitoliphagus TaxID=329406 RepID=A0A6P1E1E1_9GAMM|nr:AMP-binding protein [Thiorhodococcus mannitoliphagus]NEX22876.1 AMP-binding protein [Thiorhodococcus mannitoliphagus]
MDVDASPNLSRLLGAELQTLPALLWRRAELTPLAPARWSLGPTGWTATSWRDYRDETARTGAVLAQLKLAPGDRVGIMAPSSARWDALQMGILAAGGVVIGLDPHDREASLNAIAERCDLAGLIVAEAGLLERFAPPVRDRLHFVVALRSSDNSSIPTLDALLASAPAPSAAPPETRPDDPATIIFTSGTTGTPKGISYSHRQFVLAIASILEAFPGIDADFRLACWLPLSNLFQRMINGCAIATGAQTFYVEDPRRVMEHIGAIAPHLFIGVPRFYEKLQAGMQAKIDAMPAWQRALIAWALRQGHFYASARRAGRAPGTGTRARRALANRLVLRRMRGVMGSNLRFLVSGSAPMPRWLLEWFHAIDLLILEAYGMSENIVPIAMNRPDAYRFGSVGRVAAGNQIRLGEDEELWVRGAGVFSGYLGETASDARFDSAGFLASGDYASLDADGFVTLTGRKSEIFKTSTGRRIAPAGIEAALRQVHYVEHAALFGAGRPFLVAVLAVDEAGWTARMAGAKAAQQGARLREDLAATLANLPDYQRPAGVIVTTRALSIDRGELTANLKLRRGQVEAALCDSIERLYERLQAQTASPSQMDWDGATVLLCPLPVT